MAWNESRSRKRIGEHRKTVPEFDEKITLAKHVGLMIEARKGLMDTFSPRRAFVVEGAHLYGRLLDFDSIVADQDGKETEHSHRELLQFLDLYYQLWDEIVEADASDRVDYHGARMHAVVTQPENDPIGQVQRAFALAVRLTEASRRIAGAAGFGARIRFGIDQGRCLAMTTGRAHEKDTLFLGSPANHAAKKVAESDDEGIFFVEGLQSRTASSQLTKSSTGRIQLSEQAARSALETYHFPRLEAASARLMAKAAQRRDFHFYRPTPPLSDLQFSDLSPSNSARMDMTSLFADIDGFTSFVDGAIRKGAGSIKDAASAIHVIREELNDVLREDFGGKRVRFIGDCIQGVIGAGSRQDDHSESVRQTALCASGMQSSFSLCQKILGGVNELGLAIGIEHGPTPLTRLGQSGSESVRCAASCAVVVSERTQQSIVGSGVKLGPNARVHADSQVKKYFQEAATIIGFDAAADLLGSVYSPAVATVREDRTARPYVCKVDTSLT